MRLSLTTLLAFVVFFSFAQIPKGTISTGGELAFNFQSNARLHQTNFNLSIVPDVNFFVARNFSIGSHVGYTLNLQNNTQSNTKNQFQGFILGPNLRYYIKIADKVYAFVNGKVGYIQSREIFSSNAVFGVTKGANWQLGPGLACFLANNVALDISVLYNGNFRSLYLADKNGAITTPVKETTHGMHFVVGFKVFFPKRMLKTPVPNPPKEL